MISSKLIYSPYPDLDENDQQIYIYGFCDKNYPYLDYYIELGDKNNFEIKPIFLLLHVPINRQKQPNTAQIILQIYSFLYVPRETLWEILHEICKI